jgi:Na+-driven multidrug efflux pump
MIPQGISYSISALVGGLQAENKSNIARKYATVAYLYGQFLFIIVIIVLHMYGHQIFRRFVNNEETTARILAAMPYVFVFMLLQSSIGLLTGVIKGLG